MTQVADVLVVGGGAAGAALAWRMSQHGADVLVLEQGDWVPDDHIPKRHADWQVRARRYWSPSVERRGWPADYPVRNLGANPVDAFVYSAVGGSATGWGGAFWRFLPSDFRGATLDGFGRDWPIGYEDLERYYEINEAEMGMSGIAGDPTAPPTSEAPLPPVSMGAMGERWIDGFERLGWYWWVQHQAIASRDYRGRPACTNNGHCTYGCPTGALATPANTYWPEALRNGVRLQTGARVREITLDTRGRADGVLYHAPDGSVQRATAPVVVLAGNGLGTPRLLLMSSSSAFPDGLANSSGMVGRNLMVHVQTTVVGHFPQRTGADHGPCASRRRRQRRRYRRARAPRDRQS
jgi:choline dehydrogenase-like flavoprotein